VTRYLISFDDGTMVIPDEEFGAVGEAAHAVLREAKQAGVYIHGGGVIGEGASSVGVDGSIRDLPYPGSYPCVGGFVILDVPTRDEALRWAAKFAAACRCPQDVRELMEDPEAYA
jgi:hypothetical protein